MENKIKYQFSGKLWQDKAENGWYFVTLPAEYSNEIRENLQFQEEGRGRMKAIAILKDVKWNTSIWFDSKGKKYVLPIKAEIRKKLSLKENDKLEISIFI